MNDFEFALDTENLKKIPLHKYTTDFSFLVDGKRYRTNRFVADLLSPIIRKYHFIDETINEFSFNIESNDDKDNDYFHDFLTLSSFTKNIIDPIRRKYYSKYFLKLGNIEEYFRISPTCSEEITIENAVDQLYQISTLLSKTFYDENLQIKSKFSQNIKHLISFISKNFEFVNKEKIKELSIETIEEIISNESLQLQEEDSLLRFLIDLYKEDCKYSPLFEHVIFSNVHNDIFKEFMLNISLTDINYSIWEAICKRISLQKIKNIDTNPRYLTKSHIYQFEYYKEKEFDGIMRFLSKTTGGNIYDNGTIDITSNSILDIQKYNPKNLVDYDNNNGYASKDDGNAFICFDFKDKSIQLTNYTIQSNNSGPNYHHLKNWLLEVSNDGSNWVEIDRHENCSKLNSQNIIAMFEIHQSHDYYRFARIRQIGNSWAFWGNHNSLFFYTIEFFGNIKT
ncbi:hypothetical protein M9Y10_021040 [Tritrichomonas musculus]|uniref:BACK domain-containing protein n=1 Tax=Tritrichomonas musculus TaxID=1915356 RepID=A0ABR2HCU5_9EUKA